MKKITEGKKMFFSVMVIFLAYALIFILFEDYDRIYLQPFDEPSDWHLLIFSIVVMAILSVLLLNYSRKMDQRISKEQAEKENMMRKELTQNIAHELKTPVATILGYTDTIIENPQLPEEQVKQIIRRTNQQASRLEHILKDLSILNRMDEAQQMISRQMVDVSKLVSDIVSDSATALKQKGMTMSNCLPSSVFVNGNEELIFCIFRNLIDNAISYAGDNTEIKLTANEDGKFWLFELSDNGQGMQPKHLDRIFERFYRVDKGRSRSMGGTGLGLAIVKNAVQYHGGEIKARLNQPNGLIFNFSLHK